MVGTYSVCARRGSVETAGQAERICHECRQMLGEHLSRLQALHTECATLLAHRAPRQLERVTKTSAPGLCLNDDVMQARTRIVRLLSGWTATVARRCGGRPAKDDVPSLVAYLRERLPGVIGHGQVGALIAELAQVIGVAESAVQARPADSLTLGRCRRPGCRETLQSTASPDRQGSIQVRCDAGHVWAPHEWLALARTQGAVRGAAS